MRQIALALTLATVAGCADSTLPTLPETAPSRNAIVVHETSTSTLLPRAFTSYCTEPVALTGETKVTFHTTVSSDGGMLVRWQIASRMEGTGSLSGALYRGKYESSDEMNAHGATEWTVVENMMVHGPRSMDNFVMHTVFHMTVSAQGVPTATVDRMTVECRG